MGQRWKAFWRGFRLSVRGECKWEGCEEPRERPFAFCFKHVQEDWDRFVQARERAKFEREVAVLVEADRRIKEGEG